MPKTKEKPKKETKAIVKKEKESILTTYFELHPLGAKGRANAKPEHYGNGIYAVEGTRDSMKWALVDMMNELEERYPEEASQYRPKFMDYSTLRKWCWVGARYPMKDRVSGATFSHHEEVAAVIDIEERIKLLNQAVSENLTIVQFRKLIKESGAKKEERRPLTSVEARKDNKPIPMEVVKKESEETPPYNPEPPTEVKDAKVLTKEDGKVLTTSSSNKAVFDVEQNAQILKPDELSDSDKRMMNNATALILFLASTDPKNLDDKLKNNWAIVLEKLDKHVGKFLGEIKPQEPTKESYEQNQHLY